MKDTSFSINDSGTAAVVINQEYVKGILNQLLFLKKDDPYSNRGVDFPNAKYKNVEDLRDMENKIKNDISEYTDMVPLDVVFNQVESVLYLGLTVLYNGKNYQFAINSDTNSISALPLE